jgi:hypothetical protein
MKCKKAQIEAAGGSYTSQPTGVEMTEEGRNLSYYGTNGCQFKKIPVSLLLETSSGRF